MDVSEAIATRRSIRSFKPDPIEKEKLRKLVEAARLAPSALNRQDWRIVTVRNKETLKKLAKICDDQQFVAEADTLFVCCATRTEHIMSGGEKAYRLDVAIAMSFIMLQAVELGLGSCWIGAYNQDRLKRLLRIPDKVRVVSLLAVGYPHYVPGATGRKQLPELIASENFTQSFE